MKVNDTIRIRKTNIIGIITDIRGETIFAKAEEFDAPIMLEPGEWEPFSFDETLIGMIKQSEASK